jgi:hypothetical protein
MSVFMIFLLIGAISYLLGSIPFGYLLVRIFRGQDVRNSGSGKHWCDQRGAVIARAWDPHVAA